MPYFAALALVSQDVPPLSRCRRRSLSSRRLPTFTSVTPPAEMASLEKGEKGPDKGSLGVHDEYGETEQGKRSLAGAAGHGLAATDQ